jgi:general secretion pathway protein E
MTRLLELGVAPYLLVATINGVMAQRLVRILCPACKEKVELNRVEDVAAWDGLVSPWKTNRPAAIYKPVGCLECRMTGFLGRVGIYEVLTCSSAIKELLSEGGNEAKIRKLALKEGMRPLRLSGALKVAAGLTTIEEVAKVAPPSRDAVRHPEGARP